MRKVIYIIGLYITTLPYAFSWNATGHQLVAILALKHLTPQQISQLSTYNYAYHRGFQPRSLISAAVWLDWLRCNQPECKLYPKYHYIDIPYTNDGTATRPPDKINAVMAIEHAVQVLKDPRASNEEKGFQLRVLLHVVGDIHQPLHAVTLFNRDFPQGDRGGNAYLLGHNRVAKQLHAYWDRGGGSLTRKSLHKRHGLSNAARRLDKKYPCMIERVNMDPNQWANESYELAKNDAYKIGFQDKPDHAYQMRVRQITEQRLSLAACRLAAYLMKISVTPHHADPSGSGRSGRELPIS